MLKQRLPRLGTRLKISVDILHHDYRGIDDDAEVDRAERQEVGILSAQYQDDDREEQRKGNVDADDDGAAQIAQKHPLNEEDQQTAEDQVVQHRVRGHADQRGAVVIGHDFDPRRQTAIGVQSLDLLMNPGNDVVGVLGSSHHDDGCHNIVVAISAGNAEARHVTDRNVCDVLDLDGQAARLGQDDVFDVLHVVTIRHNLVAAAIDQPDAADIDRLLPDRDFAAADIDVGVSERGNKLRHSDIVRFELLQVGVDIELFGGSAPGIDLGHAGNSEQAARDDIVLQGAQIGQPEMRRPDDLVAVDFADQARCLDGRDQVARQGDILLQTDRSLGEREVIIDTISEGDAHKRQAVERRRADIDDAGRRIEPDLHRNGVVFLHLLRGKAGGLGGDFEDDRRRVRISFDVELRKRDDARGAKHQHAKNDDRAARETEYKERLDQERPPCLFKLFQVRRGIQPAPPSSNWLLRNTAPSVTTVSPG